MPDSSGFPAAKRNACTGLIISMEREMGFAAEMIREKMHCHVLEKFARPMTRPRAALLKAAHTVGSATRQAAMNLLSNQEKA